MVRLLKIVTAVCGTSSSVLNMQILTKRKAFLQIVPRVLYGLLTLVTYLLYIIY